MKKIFSLLILFSLLIFTGFSTNLNYETAQNDYKLDKGVLGVTIDNYVFGNDNSETTVYNNETYFMDYVIHTGELINDVYFYFTIKNAPENQLWILNCYDTQERVKTDFKYNFNFSENKTYYLKLEKDTNSKCDIYINSSTPVTNIHMRENNKRVQNIFTPLINGTQELININVSIWRVVFYTFITSLIITVVVILIKLGFYFIEKSKKLGE